MKQRFSALFERKNAAMGEWTSLLEHQTVWGSS